MAGLLDLLNEHLNEVGRTLTGNERINQRAKGYANQVESGLLSALPMLAKNPQDITPEDVINGGLLGTVGNMSKLENYVGHHRAPMKEIDNTTSALHDLLGIYGDDIYSKNAKQYYGDGYPYDMESIKVMQAVRNKPEQQVNVYRAIPSEIEDAVINNGDWVTLSKTYAKEHGENHLDGNYKLIQQKIPARKLFTDGNSIHELGYDESGRINTDLLPFLTGLGGLGVIGTNYYNNRGN